MLEVNIFFVFFPPRCVGFSICPLCFISHRYASFSISLSFASCFIICPPFLSLSVFFHRVSSFPIVFMKLQSFSILSTCFYRFHPGSSCLNIFVPSSLYCFICHQFHHFDFSSFSIVFIMFNVCSSFFYRFSYSFIISFLSCFITFSISNIFHEFSSFVTAFFHSRAPAASNKKSYKQKTTPNFGKPQSM